METATALEAASLHLSTEHFNGVKPAVQSWLEGGSACHLSDNQWVFEGRSNLDYYFVADGLLIGNVDGNATYPYFRSTIIESVRPEDRRPGKKIQRELDLVSCRSSTVWVIPRQHHLSCLEDDKFARFLYMRRSFDFRIAKNLLFIQLLSRSDEKVARMMIFLANFSGQRNSDGHIEISIDQQLLAGLCGLKRPSLNTLFRKWIDQGIIQTGFKKVTVHSEADLARISKLDHFTDSGRIMTPLEWT